MLERNICIRKEEEEEEEEVEEGTSEKEESVEEGREEEKEKEKEIVVVHCRRDGNRRCNAEWRVLYIGGPECAKITLQKSGSRGHSLSMPSTVNEIEMSRIHKADMQRH
ncbi:hypothetical protein M0804_003849 [Polistes exclamans]|nr:hypothetical protein M0804_003849 [Polistes exclamans]